MHDYVCPMGCHATQPRCADIALGNGVEVALDTPQVSPTGVDVVVPRAGAPAGMAILNTSSMVSPQGFIQLTDTDGTLVSIPAVRVEQSGGGPRVLVLKTRTFTLRAGSTLRAEGADPLVIAANFDVYIAGTLDLSGDTPSGFPTGGAGADYAGRYVSRWIHRCPDGGHGRRRSSLSGRQQQHRRCGWRTIDDRPAAPQRRMQRGPRERPAAGGEWSRGWLAADEPHTRLAGCDVDCRPQRRSRRRRNQHRAGRWERRSRPLAGARGPVAFRRHRRWTGWQRCRGGPFRWSAGKRGSDHRDDGGR